MYWETFVRGIYKDITWIEQSTPSHENALTRQGKAQKKKKKSTSSSP